MENYQIQAIRKAFERCYGLKDGLNNEGTKQISIDLLATQTGIRIDFITENLELINNL